MKTGDQSAQQPLLNTYTNVMKLLAMKEKLPRKFLEAWKLHSIFLEERSSLEVLNRQISTRLDRVFPTFQKWFPWLNRKSFEKVFMIVNLNSHHFSIVAPDFGYTGGSGLYLRASMMNHSCDYNARFLSSFVSSEKILFATRDIAKDEQICISYIEDPSGKTAIQTWVLFLSPFCSRKKTSAFSMGIRMRVRAMQT